MIDATVGGFVWGLGNALLAAGSDRREDSEPLSGNSERPSKPEAVEQLVQGTPRGGTREGELLRSPR